MNTPTAMTTGITITRTIRYPQENTATGIATSHSDMLIRTCQTCIMHIAIELAIEISVAHTIQTAPHQSQFRKD